MINSIAEQQVFASTVVEKDQRLSHSLLWRLHTAFYQQSGITAWSGGFVPHYITNNPTIAGAYARVALSYLRSQPRLDPAQPVYLLELGAGSGRFAYHFLQRFLPAAAELSLGDFRFVYLLTDLAESNVQFWRKHPRFQPYLQSGQLELACFDPLHGHDIRLEISGRTLTPADFSNPPVILANYFFDGLPCDLFSVHNGLLCEERVTLTRRGPQPDADDPAIVPSLEIRFQPRFVSPQYYPDAEFNRLLQSYLSTLEGRYLTFPVGSLESLRNLLHLTDGRMLLLAADKGEYRLEDMSSSAEPEISLHGSGISMMVNAHALAGYIRQEGGQAFLAKHREEGLVFAAFRMSAGQAGERDTRQAFREAIEEGGPDDFFMLKKAFEPHYSSATLEQLLAFLRISGDDPQIFGSMLPALMAYVESAGFYQQERLYETACRVWKMFYPMGEPFDLALAMAKLFMALGRYAEALECLQSSQAFYGRSEETGRLIEECRANIWEDEVP